MCVFMRESSMKIPASADENFFLSLCALIRVVQSYIPAVTAVTTVRSHTADSMESVERNVHRLFIFE